VSDYRVAELAREAETTVRNIRVYQDRGLLPPPRRQGRIGLYDESHLARLRLIGRLLARGYTFATIRELFDAWSGGKDLAEALGLREAVTAPWNPERPVRLTRPELTRRFGMPFSADALRRAIRLGMLVEDGTAYLVPSPNLLDAGAELVAAGVSLDAMFDLAEAQQTDLTRVAQRFVEVMLTHVVGARSLPTDDEQVLIDPLSPEAARQVLRLRPYAQRTVDALLLMAMQRETDRLLERLTPRSTADS